jgi:hypothetical protein
MAKKETVDEFIKLDSLIEREDNPRKISDYEMDQLIDSLTKNPKMMEYDGILVDEHDHIIWGHQRVKALLLMGKEVVPTSWVKKAIGLTEEEKKTFMLRSNVHNGMWDEDILKDVALFSSEELKEAGIYIAPIEVQDPFRVDPSDLPKPDTRKQKPTTQDSGYARFEAILMEDQKTELVDVLSTIVKETGYNVGEALYHIVKKYREWRTAQAS